MEVNNRTLIIDAQASNEDINELISNIVLNIEDIDEVVLKNEEEGIASSAIFSLLKSIKNKRADIKIPFLDFTNIGNMGKVQLLK